MAGRYKKYQGPADSVYIYNRKNVVIENRILKSR